MFAKVLWSTCKHYSPVDDKSLLMASSAPSRQATEVPLRRTPTAETLDSMTTDGLTHPTEETVHSPGDSGLHQRRKKRPILDRIRAKRLQVQQQQQLRGKKRSLVEDYYRVDTVAPPKVIANKKDKRFKVILPGVPTYEADRARDLHDFFNLVALVPVVVLNVLNWNWEVLVQSNSFSNIESAWTGDYFHLFFLTSVGYFLADLIWVAAIPTCVRSPSTILQHHVACLLYAIIPYNYKQSQWCIGVCMSVELNTWFLIARRVFNKQGFPPWTLQFGSWLSIRVKVISIFFYFTWISIRCILYPCILLPLYRMWIVHSKQTGSYFNLLVLAFPLHLVFCLLNLKWSYELLMSKVRYWRRCMRKTSGEEAIVDSASKGL